MKRYKSLTESSYILVGYYDNSGFHVIKTKEQFRQIRNDLLKNEKKGIFQISITIFNDESQVMSKLIKNGISRKSVKNMYDFFKNYKDINEIPEI